MPHPVSSSLKIRVPGQVAVTAKVETPPEPAPNTPLFVLAHGANNDLDHPLLVHLATRLAEMGQATVVRFNFPYSERGASSPDRREVLETAFRQVQAEVTGMLAKVEAPVFVGGKSLGGRVAAELVSRGPEHEGIRSTGLIVLGYPLHAPGRKDQLRLEPLRRIDVPSLFFVGSHDPLCDPELLRPVLARMLHPGILCVIEGGDHSLHRSGRSAVESGDSYEAVAEQAAAFLERTTS